MKHAYLSQREEERAWAIVDRILDILDKGCQFLDFNTAIDDHKDKKPNKEPMSPISDKLSSPYK